MSLKDPTKKMSKSESDKGTIYLLDDLEVTRKKIMKAVTDSENKVYFDSENKPGISNLMTIYSVLSGMSYEDIELKYKDIENYGIFKKDLADLVCIELQSIQDNVKYLKEQGDYLESILFDGFLKMSIQAKNKINYLYRKVGLR